MVLYLAVLRYSTWGALICPSSTLGMLCLVSLNAAFLAEKITILFFCLSLSGYGFSAMIPAQYAFTQAQFGLDDRVCSYFSFLSGSISLVIPLILASTFADNPLLLLHLLVAFVSLSLLIFLGLKVWIFLEARKAWFYCSFIWSQNCIKIR